MTRLTPRFALACTLACTFALALTVASFAHDTVVETLDLLTEPNIANAADAPAIPVGYRLGDTVADFSLPTIDASGKSGTFKLSEHKGKVVLINFWAVSCPFVKAYNARTAEFATKYAGKPFTMINIDSNKVDPTDTIQKGLADMKLGFAVAKDEGNKIADLFGARTTPHVYILDAEHRVAYIGAFDDNMDEPTKAAPYAAMAVDALLAGKDIFVRQTKNFGCSVKRL